MSEAFGVKANTEEEKIVIRTVIARGEAKKKWNECPCGWFYTEARCPDKDCKEWTTVNGTRRIKLYAHADKDGGFEDGQTLGLTGDALTRFAGWGYELVFDADVNMVTGEVTLVTVNGHKIFPVKG